MSRFAPARHIQRINKTAPLLLHCNVQAISVTTTLVSHRPFITNLPAVLIPPAIFLGLGVGLWIWKCTMLVVFQNKIIYMPSFPPSSRRDKISDYEKRCGGVKWREIRLKSLDGVQLAACLAKTEGKKRTQENAEAPVYVLYFQGNCSSTPPRLPLISPIVKLLNDDERRYVFLCLSYRGYWMSQGRPNEIGITKDALAALQWIAAQESDTKSTIPVVVWGQSIGCGIASTLLANHDQSCSHLSIEALVLEAPFTNVRDMLKAIYPQKWLPYPYLWPFLRNRLDSVAAMEKIAEKQKRPRITLVVAGNDELVPLNHSLQLQKRGRELGLKIERVVIANSLHEQVLDKAAGRAAITNCIRSSS